jgi:hypothetical protein
MRTFTVASRFTIARWVFSKAFGLVFFCAFVSLGVQIRGLAGAHGIVPAANFLTRAWDQYGSAAVWKFPTLCWINASDTMLVGLCVAGAVISVVLICGVLPGLCTLLLWALYGSLCWIAMPFTLFQWDTLLLEAALPAAVLLPWRFRPRWDHWHPAQQAALWLLWWLLFRLMFESGVVKFSSGDKTWWGFTALDYHFETQPLPLWTAWYAHQIPKWILSTAVFIMFLIEILAPLLIVAPRGLRHGAGWALIALQVAILTTGNFAFFNWLTIALCLLLFDDGAWLRGRVPENRAPDQSWTPWVWGLTAPVLALVVLLTLQPLLSPFGIGWPESLATLDDWVQPLLSFNGYGLFRVMTTSRNEISVEGSDDLEHWKEYEFRWKPGDLNRRPKLVAPHQPRLDWQMWFAALGSLRNNAWFVNFLVRLMEGSTPVLDLLRTNPFPDHPPHYIRAVEYDYHFTRFGDGHSGWWKREPLGLYCPPIMLGPDGQPVLAEPGRADASAPNAHR